MKKRNPPITPYRETIPGYLRNQVSKPARACEKPRLKCTCSYREAGAAAAEIVGSCFGTMANDYALWAWYCRHFDTRLIVEKAHEYASMQRCGEVRDALTAFQSWLTKEFPKGGM